MGFMSRKRSFSISPIGTNILNANIKDSDVWLSLFLVSTHCIQGGGYCILTGAVGEIDMCDANNLSKHLIIVV